MEVGAKFQVPAAEQGRFAARIPGRYPVKNQHDGRNTTSKCLFCPCLLLAALRHAGSRGLQAPLKYLYPGVPRPVAAVVRSDLATTLLWSRAAVEIFFCLARLCVKNRASSKGMLARQPCFDRYGEGSCGQRRQGCCAVTQLLQSKKIYEVSHLSRASLTLGSMGWCRSRRSSPASRRKNCRR